MKILAVSDSHGQFERFYSLCKDEKPDVVLFSGDGASEAQDLEILFPEIKFFMVRGNCDYNSYEVKDEIIIELEGIKFFITHGHYYNVKRSYRYLEEKGCSENIDIIVFGHTHIPEYKEFVNKEKHLTLFNPGAVINNRYGIIDISATGEIKFKHKTILNFW